MSTPAHLEVFASEYHMLKFFGQYLPDLDVDTSARLSPFLYSYDGELVLARNLYEFLIQMEDRIALGIDVNSSVQRMKSFMVFFNEKPKDPVKFAESISVKHDFNADEMPMSTTFVEAAPVVEESAPVVEEAPTVTEEVVVGETDKEAILKEAEALRESGTKAVSKAALEAFALTKGVSLSKAKTFDGMMEDFAAAL